MEYTSLYRKFRPLTFKDMVGQEHIIRTIKNQIIAKRIGHAYLFTGGRGTGKTSAAKILARAANCLNPEEGEPCNKCQNCKTALNGTLTDIVEMDAASNNSVEDIRSIREEVNFLPSVAKYRIYIIDEVHMLSTGAFNALLKTLEEPPAHVKFILATTEPQKLPATILSRCQRFDFKKISPENIVKRLKIVCKEGAIEITQEALNLIAVLAEGAMRDALSILERCVQEKEGEITEEKIKELVGIPKTEYIQEIVEAVIDNEVENALTVIDKVILEGKELSSFLWEIVKYIKDLLIYKTSKKLEIYNKKELTKIEELSEKVSKERLIKLINMLSELENNMKWSSQKQILFQTGIIKACSNFENQGIEELEKRICKLEEKIKNGAIMPKQQIQEKEKTIPITQVQKENKEAEKREKIISEESINKEYLPFWPKVLEGLKNSGKLVLYTNLINTNAKEVNDMTIGIEFEGKITSFGKTVIEKPENMQELMKIVSQEYGKPMTIKLIEKQKEKKKEKNQPEDIAKELELPINIIEE